MNRTLEQVLEDLIALNVPDGDTEYIHGKADALLKEALLILANDWLTESRGVALAEKIVSAFNDVPKWYS